MKGLLKVILCTLVIELAAGGLMPTGTANGAGGGYPAPVAKTGQTEPYVTGDDGDLEKGLSPPSLRFTDNQNGTVTDKLTGLVWLKDADCIGRRQWADASTQVSNLNSGTNFSCDGYTASTYSDWRLPTPEELTSLIDSGRFSPALPSGHPFTGVQNSSYWSSTTYASDTGNAWVVYMYNGYVNTVVKTTTYYVWPVRGGQ